MRALCEAPRLRDARLRVQVRKRVDLRSVRERVGRVRRDGRGRSRDGRRSGGERGRGRSRRRRMQPDPASRGERSEDDQGTSKETHRDESIVRSAASKRPLPYIRALSEVLGSERIAVGDEDLGLGRRLHLREKLADRGRARNDLEGLHDLVSTEHLVGAVHGLCRREPSRREGDRERACVLRLGVCLPRRTPSNRVRSRSGRTRQGMIASCGRVVS